MEVHEQRSEHAVEAPPAAPAPYPPPPPTGEADREVVGRSAASGAYTPPGYAPPPGYGPPAGPSGGRYVHTSYVSSMPVGYRPRQILWLAYGIVAAFLLVDLIFHAAGANTASSFVTFVYNVGGAFNAPFRNIISGERPGVSTIEWADVIALVIYAGAAYAVERVIVIMRTPSHPTHTPY